MIDDRAEARRLVLNALIDVVNGGGGLLADDGSKALVRDRYESAVGSSDRAAFRQEIDELRRLSRGEFAKSDYIVDETVAAVLDVFESEGIRAIVEHESHVTFSPSQVACYSFMCSPSPESIDWLSFPHHVRSIIIAGAELAAEGEFDPAVDQFERAIAGLDSGDDLVTVRLLAGWSSFWAGNDAAAVDFADEALELAGDVWEAKALWVAATHNQSEQIRTGDIDLRLVLNWVSSIPAGCTMTIETGLARNDGEEEWTRSTDQDECIVFNRIGPEMRLRFRLEGKLPAFPKLFSYYLGFGTVYPTWNEISEIERVIVSGPETIESIESLRFVRTA